MWRSYRFPSPDSEGFVNNYCLYPDGPVFGDFEPTIRVEHERLPHLHTHPELQLCENFANKKGLFYLCILQNT